MFLQKQFALLHSLLTKQQRTQLYMVIVASMFMVFLEVFSIGFIYPVLILFTEDRVVIDSQFVPEYFAQADTLTLVFFALGILLAIYLLKNCYIAGVYYFQSKLLFRMKASLEMALLRKFSEQDLKRNPDDPSSHVRSLILVECARLYPFVLFPAVTLIAEFALFMTLLLAFFFLMPVFVKLVALLLVVVMALMGLLTQRWMKGRGARRTEKEQEKIAALDDAIGGSVDAEVLGQRSHFQHRFDAISRAVARVEADYSFVSIVSRPTLELVGVITFVLLTILMLSSGMELSAVIPILGMFVAAAFRLLPCGTRMVQSFQSLKYATATLTKLQDFLARPNAVSGCVEVDKTWQTIEVSDIHFRYGSHKKDVLQGLTKTVKRGDWIAITGPSGSGKSTLVKLLLGLYQPDRGSITVDGQHPMHVLKKDGTFLGYVSQNIFLMNSSVKDNVLFGRPAEAYSEAQIDTALRTAGLDTFVSGLPAGVDTIIGEGGASLSGGERQRIGIARALLAEPDVLLLDEFSSALDKETEKRVLRSLKGKFQHKTVIMITHRDAILEYCDVFMSLTPVHGDKRVGRPVSA